MNWNSIKYEFFDNGIALITLNRPKFLNALDDGMREDFKNLSSVLVAKKVKAVIFTGSGKAFCAGGDISHFEKKWNASNFTQQSRVVSDFYDFLEDLPKPVFAAINGVATGAGIQLAMACDIRVMSSDAKAGFREHQLNLIPSHGGTYRLVKLLGLSKAKHFYLSESLSNADELFRLGFVSKVVESEKLLEFVFNWVESLLKRAPMATGEAIKLLNMMTNIDRDCALEKEYDSQKKMLLSKDHHEGVKAFREKRKPSFKGD